MNDSYEGYVELKKATKLLVKGVKTKKLDFFKKMNQLCFFNILK